MLVGRGGVRRALARSCQPTMCWVAGACYEQRVEMQEQDGRAHGGLVCVGALFGGCVVGGSQLVKYREGRTVVVVVVVVVAVRKAAGAERRRRLRVSEYKAHGYKSCGCGGGGTTETGCRRGHTTDPLKAPTPARGTSRTGKRLHQGAMIVSAPLLGRAAAAHGGGALLWVFVLGISRSSPAGVV